MIFVTYFIPKKDSVHTYSEPLIKGQNDDPTSLSQIREKETLERINCVRKLYHLLNDEIRKLEKSDLGVMEMQEKIANFELNFYKASGIIYPVNEPLEI